MTEAEIAADVVAWLEGQHYDVYQEVQVEHYGRRADIVAVINKRIWVIETKKTLSLSVIEQADQWVGKAHWVSVCVPAIKHGYASRQFAQKVLKQFGIGFIRYDNKQGWRNIQEYRGALHRKITPHLKELLESHGEEFRGQLAAGSNKGGYWTPFKHTCTDLVRYVSAYQGCTMKAAIEGITHHYSSDASARSSLASHINAGIVKEIRIKYEEGETRLYWEKVA